MAILVSEAIASIRERTRHDVDTRVSNALIMKGLNAGAKKLRGWLAADVPTLYLVSSAAIDVTAAEPEIPLVSTAYTFENLHRVERFWEGVGWRKIERAGSENPNVSVHGGLTFQVEHLCLIIGPDNREDITGQYRIKFHPAPAPLSTPADDAEYLQVPDALDEALLYLGRIPVAERDGDSADGWSKKAKAEYDEALPFLRERYGTHQNTAGLNRIMGY